MPEYGEYIEDHGYYRAVVQQTKNQPLAIVNEWQIGRADWPSVDHRRLVAEGFNVNAAVSACIRVHAFTYPEPQPIVKDQRGDPVDSEHPLQDLLNYPNEDMDHDDLMGIVAQYKAIGGNCYLYILRNTARVPVALIPFHDGMFTPIVGDGSPWIEAYEYDVGDGRKVRIEREDVIHLKWPVRDMERPWMGMSPLRQIAREVDQDSEMTRMLYAFLRNDATPRTLLVFPQGTSLGETARAAMREQFKVNHGDLNRGGVAYVTGGASVERLSLNMRDLDLSALRGVPEARICAAFGVPAEVAGLTIGMAHSTENNLAAADKRFTDRTLMPLWKRDAGMLTRQLARQYGPFSIEYDTSGVSVLQEDEGTRVTRYVELWKNNGITRNELRDRIGFVPEGEIQVADGGDIYFDGSIPSANKPQEPEPPAPPPPIITEVAPPQLTDGQAPNDDALLEEAVKLYVRRQVKARKTERERTADEMAAAVGSYLERQRAAAMEEA